MTKKEKNASGKAGAGVTAKPPPPPPVGLTFTLLHPVEILVSGPDLEEKSFKLDHQDSLLVAQRAWRRRAGIPDGRRNKVGPNTMDAILAIEDFARHHPRDLSLSPGTLAKQIILHADRLGLGGRLTDDGSLWDICDRLLVHWKQQAHYEAG
jgi:hypothetical protein